MGLLVSKSLYQLDFWRLQRGGVIDELTEMHYHSKENEYDIGTATFSRASPHHITDTANWGLTNYNMRNSNPGDYHTFEGTVKLLAEAGKLSHLKKIYMYIGPQQCSSSMNANSSFFECLFKLMGIEGATSPRVQQPKLKEENSCILMEEGGIGSGEPTLIGANINLTQAIGGFDRQGSFNPDSFDVEQKIDLSAILGLNARHTEVHISTYSFAVSSPPPLLNDELLLAGGGSGRFDGITKLLLTSINNDIVDAVCPEKLANWKGERSVRGRWAPFPAREWAVLIARILSVCGALNQFIVKISLCDSIDFEKSVPEVADRYWMAVDAMGRELRAISGVNSAVAAAVQVQLNFNIQEDQLIKRVRHDHPLFRKRDFKQAISCKDSVAYHHGLVIREGTRGGGPGEGEGFGGGIEGPGSMVVTWYVHCVGNKIPRLGHLYWMKWPAARSRRQRKPKVIFRWRRRWCR